MRITERLAWPAATCFGLGKIPWAPGTWGSGVGILLAWATAEFSFGLKIVFLFVLILLGVWSSEKVARRLEEKDPSCVIIDEMAGAYLAALSAHTLFGFLSVFFLFRVFDILKPWPVRAAEKLSGGFGIMADDLVAGGILSCCFTLFF